MKKIYQAPESVTTEIFVEGTILSMSMGINGEVHGTIGTQHSNDPWNGIWNNSSLKD